MQFISNSNNATDRDSYAFWFKQNFAGWGVACKLLSPMKLLYPLCLSMVLLFFHNSAFAQHPTFTRGDLLFTLTYDNNLQRDAVVVSAANKEISGDITIPASITINTNIQNSELLSVIGVLDNGFKECSKITSVIMPNTISTIDRNAFNGCTELKSVSLSDGLTWISEGAFANCKSLTEITIPDGVNYMGSSSCGSSYGTTSWGIFENCDNLKKATLPAGCSYVGYRCFKGCKNLVDVFIPTTVTTISDEAFWSCGITNLDYLPSSIESIGSRAFRACYYINNLRLPDSIKHLYNGAFEFCGFVNEIHIPGSIESIGDGALNCSWQGTDTYVTDIYYYSQDPIVCDDPFFYIAVR